MHTLPWTKTSTCFKRIVVCYFLIPNGLNHVNRFRKCYGNLIFSFGYGCEWMRPVQWAERGTAVTEQRSSLKCWFIAALQLFLIYHLMGLLRYYPGAWQTAVPKKNRILPSFLNLFLFSAVHLLNYKQTVLKIWDFRGYQIRLQRHLSTLHMRGIQVWSAPDTVNFCQC